MLTYPNQCHRAHAPTLFWGPDSSSATATPEKPLKHLYQHLLYLLQPHLASGGAYSTSL